MPGHAGSFREGVQRVAYLASVAAEPGERRDLPVGGHATAGNPLDHGIDSPAAGMHLLALHAIEVYPGVAATARPRGGIFLRMITLRIGTEEIRLEPEEWALWVQDGRIPADARLWLEGTGWVPVSSIPDYQQMTQGERKRPARFPEVFSIAFPRRGVSATEAFLLVNLLVAGVLAAVFGQRYLAEIHAWATGAWFAVRDRHEIWWWLPTLFLHAGPRHLFANMMSLLATATSVEYLMGRRWVTIVYFIAGIGGMWLSFEGHGQPPLSIGASGAIFGLGGATIAFVLRRHRSFTYRQRWKARRVYAPLFLFLVLPSVLNADYLGHVGGLVSGLALGLFIPPHRRLRLGDDGSKPADEVP